MRPKRNQQEHYSETRLEGYLKLEFAMREAA